MLWESEAHGLRVPGRPRCSDQTQMFWLLTFLGFLMEELNPDPGLFLPWMNFYYDRDWDTRKTKREKRKKLPLELWRCRPVCKNMEAGVWAGVSVCRWGDTRRRRRKASSFLVVQTQSHKSVTGQFLTHLRQHRLDLSLPSKHKRPPVWAGRRTGWKKRLMW